MKIYFICMPAGPPSQPAYQFQLVYLAQGLAQIGVEFGSNRDYWQLTDGTFLFKTKPEFTPQSSDVIVVSSLWYDYGNPHPEAIVDPAVKGLKVLIDTSDGLRTVTHQEIGTRYDVILKQKNRKIPYPDNVKSAWTFGLSQEVVDYLAKAPSFLRREKSTLVNFRHAHVFRRMASEKLIPALGQRLPADYTQEPLGLGEAKGTKLVPMQLELLQCQSGGRHQTAYLNRLLHHAACVAFGGGLIPQALFWKLSFLWRFKYYFYDGHDQSRVRKMLSRWGLTIQHTYGIYQWDSWRWWESLAAGCLTFHVDLEKYGVEMPVMPRNWEHYIGVDFCHLDRDIERLNSLSDNDLAQIAEQGRKWSLENYAPKPVARRFIHLIQELN